MNISFTTIDFETTKQFSYYDLPFTCDSDMSTDQWTMWSCSDHATVPYNSFLKEKK